MYRYHIFFFSLHNLYLYQVGLIDVGFSKSHFVENYLFNLSDLGSIPKVVKKKIGLINTWSKTYIIGVYIVSFFWRNRDNLCGNQSVYL